MDSKKGLVTFFPAILLAFALFAFVAMIFLVANVLFAESQQEAVIYNLRNVDDDITLQALLRYNYHGKMLGDWLVLGAGMKDEKAYKTFSEGFSEPSNRNSFCELIPLTEVLCRREDTTTTSGF